MLIRVPVVPRRFGFVSTLQSRIADDLQVRCGMYGVMDFDFQFSRPADDG